ncbi:hypothetical protein UFOVP615_16 [uncultured Caudovirales phage]|uniref:Uncharacterized protein n=1 Tax=uncultured Caudovirales phage TaxID=2100421 RepID=A0A6J5N056_9CAUD|nr:hypothetical protein UFOVP615_16 [uncultured Caudovirales phage]
MEKDNNQLQVLKDKTNLIVFSEENSILEKIIISKNHFCYPIYCESSPKLNDLTEEELFLGVKIILNNIALFMNIQEPSPLLAKMIADKVIEKFSYYRIAEIERALNMGAMGELLGEDGKQIKCYNNINGVWVFECLNSYTKKRMDEIAKLQIAKNALLMKIPEKSEKATDDVFYENMRKIKSRLGPRSIKNILENKK